MKNFSARLEEARGSRSQREFARFLGIPLNTYTNWVRGLNRPRADQLEKVCTALGVDPGWFIGVEHHVSAPDSVRESGARRGDVNAEDAAPYDACAPCLKCAEKQAKIDRLEHHVDVLMRALETRMSMPKG